VTSVGPGKKQPSTPSSHSALRLAKPGLRPLWVPIRVLLMRPLEAVDKWLAEP